MTRADLNHFVAEEVKFLQSRPDGTNDYEVAGRFTTPEGLDDFNWCWLLGEGRECFNPSYLERDRTKLTARFVFHREQQPPKLKSYVYLCAGWQAYNVWMIEEPSWHWKEITFAATPAVEYPATGTDGSRMIVTKPHTGEELTEGVKLLPEGWDHEHCELCNFSIEPGMTAYVDEDDHYLCSKCYSAYRVPRSLAFVREL
jgi:hypothetical protein